MGLLTGRDEQVERGGTRTCASCASTASLYTVSAAPCAAKSAASTSLTRSS